MIDDPSEHIYAISLNSYYLIMKTILATTILLLLLPLSLLQNITLQTPT